MPRRTPSFIQFKQIGKKVINGVGGRQKRFGGAAVWSTISKSIEKVVPLKTVSVGNFDANFTIFCSLLSRASTKLATFFTEELDKCTVLSDRRDKCSTTLNHGLSHWYNGVEFPDRSSCMRAANTSEEKVFFIHFVLYKNTRELTWHVCFESLARSAEVTCNHPEWLSLSSAIEMTNTSFPPQLPFSHTASGRSIWSLFRNYYGPTADPLAEAFASRGKMGISGRSLMSVQKDRRLCQPSFTIDYETRQLTVEKVNDVTPKNISLPYMISFGLCWYKCQKLDVCTRWHRHVEDTFYNLADQEKKKRGLLAKVIKCRIINGEMVYSSHSWEDFKGESWFSLSRDSREGDVTVDEQLSHNPNQTLSGISFYLNPEEEYTAAKSASFVEFVNVLMFDFVQVLLEKAYAIFDRTLDAALVDSLRLLQITFNGAGYDNVFNISKVLELKQIGAKMNDFTFKSDTFYERGKTLGLFKATYRRPVPGRKVGFHVTSIDVLEYTKTSLSNACKEYGILGSKLDTIDPGLAEIAYEIIDILPLDGIREQYSRSAAVAEVCDIFKSPLLFRHAKKHETALRRISTDVLGGSTNIFDFLAFYNVVDAFSTFSLFSVVEKVSNEATETLCQAYNLPFKFTVDLMKKQTMPSFAVSQWRLLYHLRVLIDANFRLDDQTVKERSVYPSQGLLSLLTRMNVMGGKTVANVITPPGYFIDHIASVDLASCYATAACAIMPTGHYSMMTYETLGALQSFIDEQTSEIDRRVRCGEDRYFPSFYHARLPFFIHLCYIEPSEFSLTRYPDFGILMDKLFVPTSNAVKVSEHGMAYLNFENLNLVQSADTNIWSHRARTIFLDAINVENLIYAGFSVKLLSTYTLADVDGSVEDSIGDLGFCCSWSLDVLGPFQKTLSEKRLEAKANGESAKQAFLKMEGNATYGKHCEKSYRGKYVNVTDERMESATDYLSQKGHKINFSHKLSGGTSNSNILAYTEIFPYDPTVSSPILGVAILSQSRRQLLHLYDKLKGSGASLDPNFSYIYGDTDSVFVPNSSLKNVDPRSWMPGLSPFSVEKNDYDPLHLSLDYSDACVAVFAKKFYCVVEQKKDVDHDQVYEFLNAFRINSFERASSLASLVNITIKMAGVPVKAFTSAKKDRIYQDFEQSYCDPLYWLKVFFTDNPTEISWFRLSLKTPGKKVRHAVVDPKTLAEFDFYIERVAQKRKIQRTLDGGVHEENPVTKVWHTRAPKDLADFAYCQWASKNRHLHWTGEQFVRTIESPTDIIDLFGGRERPISSACLYFLASRSYLLSYLPSFGYNGEPTTENDDERGGETL